jgi:hypothetical protein
MARTVTVIDASVWVFGALFRSWRRNSAAEAAA